MNHHGIIIDWTPEEEAKIKKARSWAMARRCFGLNNNGNALTQFNKNPTQREALRRLAHDIYKGMT